MNVGNSLVQEVVAEVQWLSQRQCKFHQASLPNDYIPDDEHIDNAFPTALKILGFSRSPQLAGGIQYKNDGTVSANVTNAEVLELVCITERFVTPKNDKYSRQRPKWAALVDIIDEFGDDIEANVLNPCVAVQVDGKSKKEDMNDTQPAFLRRVRWLCHPFENSTLSFKIMTAATRTSAVLGLLGDPAPLSPVIQPQLQFHLKRNKRRTCHLHFEHNNFNQNYYKSFDQSAHQAAIDMDEPFSSPPLCSCPNEELLSSYHKFLDPFQSNGVDFDSKESQDLMNEAHEFLNRQGICQTCGGLHYFPFSTFELLLTHDVTTLMELCEKYPLPPNTDVYCDGPKISACIVTKSAAHEWDIFKSLIAVKCNSFNIHDFCSIHFWPGTQVSDFYWSKAASSCQRSSQPDFKVKSATSNEAAQSVAPFQSIPSTPVFCQEGSTLLLSPAQFLLNIHNQKASTWSSPISSFSARALRRPYCIRRRSISDSQMASAVAFLNQDDLEQIENTHHRVITSPELECLIAEQSRLKFRLAAVTKELQGLREEFLALQPQAQRELG